MAQNKIPVLTEVYNPKKRAKATKSTDTPLDVTAELVAKVSTQMRPALEAGMKGVLMGEMRTEVGLLCEQFVSAAEMKDSILAELRAEMKAMRTEALSSTQGLIRESNSEVALDMVSELTAKLTPQVKLKLEAEIADLVLDELRVEINKARGEMISSIEDFVDKAKADLKTEVPKIYQDSVDLAQMDLVDKFEGLQSEASAKVDASLVSVFAAAEQIQALQQQLLSQHQSELSDSFSVLQKTVGESMQTAMHEELRIVQDKAMQDHQSQLMEALDGFIQIQGEKAENTLMQKIQAYHGTLHVAHQEQVAKEMATALEAIAKLVDESTEEQVDLMHTQVSTIQQEAFAKLREALNLEKESVFNTAALEVQTTLADQMTAQSEVIRNQFLSDVNGDLPNVQALLYEGVQAVLANAIPEMEGRLRDQLTADLQQLLLSVKFVLPN